MEAFLWTVAAMAIGSITFIAYRHSSGFKKNFAWPLIILAGLAVLFGTAHQGGRLFTFTDIVARQTATHSKKLADLVAPVGDLHLVDRRNQARHIAANARDAADAVGRLQIIWIAGFGVIAYVTLLMYLDRLIKDDDDDDANPEEAEGAKEIEKAKSS